jgi:hypothetical protein
MWYLEWNSLQDLEIWVPVIVFWIDEYNFVICTFLCTLHVVVCIYSKVSWKITIFRKKFVAEKKIRRRLIQSKIALIRNHDVQLENGRPPWDWFPLFFILKKHSNKKASWNRKGKQTKCYCQGTSWNGYPEMKCSTDCAEILKVTFFQNMKCSRT